MSEQEDEFTRIQKLVGPKRVRTEEVDIEAHDPEKIQKLMERQSSKPIRFSLFGGSVMRPKNADCICEEDDTECGS